MTTPKIKTVKETPKRPPQKPTCPTHKIDMVLLENSKWQCTYPGCRTVMRPKKTEDPEGDQIMLGRGAIRLLVTKDVKHGRHRVVLIGENNVGVDITLVCDIRELREGALREVQRGNTDKYITLNSSAKLQLFNMTVVYEA